LCIYYILAVKLKNSRQSRR